MSTVPDVFIIETLDPDDEGNGRFEGSSISHVLKLHGKRPIYQYVRTRSQFKAAINQFAASRYRYLHISAHADDEGMCTTNLDQIDYRELAKLLTPGLKGRRLFLSACSMVHEAMASEIIPKTGCISVVGPREDISFTTAAVFWPAVYHLMFTHNDAAMGHLALKRNLQKVTELFHIDIGYFSRSKKLKRGFTKDFLRTA